MNIIHCKTVATSKINRVLNAQKYSANSQYSNHTIR